MDKHSRSPVTTWLDLLVLEALVGKMLWKPLMGCITSPRIHGWKTVVEALYNMWVDLLVLEALAGTNALEALEGLDGAQSNDGFGDVRPGGGITV